MSLSAEHALYARYVGRKNKTSKADTACQVIIAALAVATVFAIAYTFVLDARIKRAERDIADITARRAGADWATEVTK